MSNKGYKVVLVEDNPADAEILRMALEREEEHVEITHFSSADPALRFFGVEHALNGASGPYATHSGSSDEIDLVLLDLNLPRISGFDILQRMRAMDHLRYLPIVILSGSSNPEEIARCQKLGATAYMCKPSHLQDIFKVAHQLVGMLHEIVKSV